MLKFSVLSKRYWWVPSVASCRLASAAYPFWSKKEATAWGRSLSASSTDCLRDPNRIASVKSVDGSLMDSSKCHKSMYRRDPQCVHAGCGLPFPDVSSLWWGPLLELTRLLMVMFLYTLAICFTAGNRKDMVYSSVYMITVFGMVVDMLFVLPA